MERVPEEREDDGRAGPEDHPVDGAGASTRVGHIQTKSQEEKRNAEEEVPIGTRFRRSHRQVIVLRPRREKRIDPRQQSAVTSAPRTAPRLRSIPWIGTRLQQSLFIPRPSLFKPVGSRRMRAFDVSLPVR